ncbi:MAG: hypothetical protein JNL67_18065 [Planctomycetaceae bacterium]|nr:hypothetical protein [Planctomycetaceae bacterium]
MPNSCERNPKFQQPLVLLGQQREIPRLQAVLEQRGISGPVGLVSAGWEEDEDDDQWVRDAVDNPVVNSHLYALADDLFQRDPEVIQLLRERQDRLRELREINELQTEHLGTVARELWRRLETHVGAATSLRQTMEQIQEIDRSYLESISVVIAEYDHRIAPKERPSVLEYRARVLERLQECQALFIAGGHVGVLLNRLNLCRLLQHVQLPIIAWSGGAMALGECVYFYDHFLPHTKREIELSRRGMGLFTGVQVFPRANQRLSLHDSCELGLLARRLKCQCLLLDERSEIGWSADGHPYANHVRYVDENGEVQEWKP